MKGYDDSSETKYIEHTVVNDFVSAVFPFHAQRPHRSETTIQTYTNLHQSILNYLSFMNNLRQRENID